MIEPFVGKVERGTEVGFGGAALVMSTNKFVGVTGMFVTPAHNFPGTLMKTLLSDNSLSLTTSMVTWAEIGWIQSIKLPTTRKAHIIFQEQLEPGVSAFLPPRAVKNAIGIILRFFLPHSRPPVKWFYLQKGGQP